QQPESHVSSLHQPACFYLLSASASLPHTTCLVLVAHYLLSTSANLSNNTSSVHQPASPKLPPQ
ncbi:hypothetical protein BaRGS_00026188, partial [Batillaria attramentaria]